MSAPGAAAAAPPRSYRDAQGRLDWPTRLGFFAMICGMFMAVLDIQIVSASLSEIQAGLNATPEEASWVQTSYLIAEVVMIPLTGWLSRLMSTRLLFVLSVAGFTLCSLLCSLANSLETMIVCRAAQGFIGGAMIPTVITVSYMLFPGRKRSQASMVIGLTVTLAPTLGPTLGGWLTQILSWHWLFLVNVPIGIAITLASWSLVDLDRPDWSLRNRFDRLGLLYMAAFLGSLEFVLEEGTRRDWFEDEAITLFGAVALVSGALFFQRVFTRPDPIVDLRPFANRNFTIGAFFGFVTGVGLFGTIYVLPLFLARVRGYDSMTIGTTMFVTGAFMFMCGPISARVSNFLDLRVMLAIGLTMFGGGIWMMASLTSQSAFWDLFLPQAMRGASMMWVMLPINQLSLATLPESLLKSASGLYSLMRNLGGAFGLATLNTLMAYRYGAHHQHLAEQVTWSRPATGRTLDGLAARLGPSLGESGELAAMRKIAAMVQREALALTYNDALMAIAALFFLAVPFTLLLAKPQR